MMIRRKDKDYPEVKGPLFKKEERKVLIFRVAREEYGMDLSYVREVIKVNEIKSLSQTPEFIEGVTYLRGHLIALVNLRKRLHLKESEVPERKVIICRVQGKILGFLVEELREIISLSREGIFPLPEIVSNQAGSDLISEIAQIEGRMIPLLNLEKVFADKEDRST